MKSILKKICSPGDTNFWESIGILFLRLYLGGAMFLAHGLGKIEAGPANLPNPFDMNPFFNGLLIIFAEGICSLLILLGLVTRAASLVLFICMFVAFFIAHKDDPFKVRELAFVYMMGYTALVFTGAGSLSIDKLIGRKA